MIPRMTTEPHRAIPEVALASLAILKVNWDTHGRDHIANFLPFVCDALRGLPQDEIAFDDLQREIVDSFGLVIPHGPLRTILGRAQREKLVTVTDGIYRRTGKCVALEPLASMRDDALREYANLVEKLTAFARERHDVEWTEEEAEAALLEYVGGKAGPILSASLTGAPFVESSPAESGSAATYIINTFVVHLHERDADGFGFLETVVKGTMLAHVLYYPDLGSVAQRMRGVEVFFDTRIILEAIVGNEYQKRVRQSLFDLVYELGGFPRVFDDTLREVQGVLNFTAGVLRRGTVNDRHYGLLTEQLVERGVEASDLELIIARLPKILGSLKISATGRPEAKRSLTVDEAKLASVLASTRRDGDPKSSAVLHDVDVVTAIYRLRGGREQYRLESCRAVFVTTNYPMVTATREFFADEYDASCCVTATARSRLLCG